MVAAGVTRVDGRIAGDGSRYDDVRYNPAWDESLRGVEGGPIGALLVDDGWTSASPDDIATDLCDAAYQILSLDPNELPLRLGRSARLATPAQRRAARARSHFQKRRCRRAAGSAGRRSR